MNFATILNPIKDLVGVSAPQSSRGSGQELPKNPKSALERRLSAIKYLSEIPQNLEEQNRKWVARLPEGNPSGAMDFALFHFPRSHLDCPDKSLPDDLANGDARFGGRAGFMCVPETCAPG